MRLWEKCVETLKERGELRTRAGESARLHSRKARLGLTFDVKLRASFASLPSPPRNGHHHASDSDQTSLDE
jgi:hypothetical protein